MPLWLRAWVGYAPGSPGNQCAVKQIWYQMTDQVTGVYWSHDHSQWVSYMRWGRPWSYWSQTELRCGDSWSLLHLEALDGHRTASGGPPCSGDLAWCVCVDEEGGRAKEGECKLKKKVNTPQWMQNSGKFKPASTHSRKPTLYAHVG